MRELINLITESVGLANRKPGESFINSKGDLLIFVGLNFYPDSGKFNDHRDLQAQIDDIEKRTGTKIEFTNQTNAKMLAFGVVQFKDPNGGTRLFGRYFASINQIFTANFWPNSGIPDGFKYNRASATKMASGLMPQDILTNMEDQTPESILEQVSVKFGTTHPLTKLTKKIVAGQSLPLAIDVSSDPELSFEGFRDYFCEILQPIAILRGTTEGNAEEAISTFFGKKGTSGVTITFSSGKNAGLFDSLLVAPDGKQIKVSTKGNLGAQASVGNLIDAVNDLEITGNVELRNMYSNVIDIIKIVKSKGYIDGPLTLAEQYGIISGKEADIVRSMKTAKSYELTPTLQELYDKRAAGADLTRLVPFYNMLAAVAYAVADYINENTNFSDAATDILNHSALIQVYTTASEKTATNEYVLQRFRSMYPSKLIAGVQFSPYKNYFSSGNKGNFTFKILANKQDADVEPTASVVTPSTISAQTTQKVNNVVNHHAAIRPPGAAILTPSVGRDKKPSAPRARK